MTRPARLKLATISVLAVCAASLAGAPSGMAAIATDSGVHAWLFDGSNQSGMVVVNPGVDSASLPLAARSSMRRADR